MKRYKPLLVILLFLFTTPAFPWGSELCQGCRIDSSALAGPIYTWPNSTMLQQMISTNGTFLFQDDVNLYPQYSNGIKLEIRTQSKSPLRLAYDVNNYVDFSVGAGGSLTINATGGVVISPNGNVVIRTGNVGIGTTNPVVKLDIYATEPVLQLTDSTNGGRFFIQRLNTANGAMTRIYDGTDYSTYFKAGNVGIGYADPGTAKLAINGNVGIGTTSPGAKLHVLAPDATAGGAWVSEAFRFAPANYPAAYGSIWADMSGLSAGMSFGVIGLRSLYIAGGSGNVGIGTTVPNHKLDVVGSMYSRRYAATTAIDWNNGNTQSLTLVSGGNTLTFSNGQDGGKYTLILKQPASGAAGTVTYPATVRWSGATAPTLTATNSKTDYIGFIYNGVDSKYDGVAAGLNF